MINPEDLAILFVDDEADILSSLSRFLRREPYRKLFAESGREALELLDGNNIAIIVSDLRMPEMNGLEVISEVKKRNPEIIRLILSGSQDFDQIIESINKGEVFRFIPKPVDPEAFKTILQDAIDYFRLKAEREELFSALSVKNQELLSVNNALSIMAEELRQSEEKYRSMTDAAHDAVFMLNPHGTIIYRNTASEAIFGFSRVDYPQQQFRELISPEESALMMQEKEALPFGAHSDCNDGRIRQINGLRKDGSTVPLEISRGCVEIDAVNHTVVIARDITSRVEAERSQKHYESMERELESEIEKKLLQSPAPLLLEEASISQLMIPSGHLDGDFTDFIVYDRLHADILIGDVMGHGIQSALVGAGLKSLFLKVLAQNRYRSGELPVLSEIVAGVHELCINELMELGTFATLLLMRLDLESGLATMIDCGHPAVIHFHAATGCCTLCKGEQMPIGMIEQQEYSSISYQVSRDDLLLLYSDGITESCSVGNRQFGVEKLVELVEKHHELTPEALINHIRTSVSGFTGRETFDDDITCILIRIGEAGKRGRA